MSWLTPLDTSTPWSSAEPPPENILKEEVIASTISLYLAVSVLLIENKSTKKHKSRFIRSEKVAIHSGAPALASSGFFFLAIFYSSPPPSENASRSAGVKNDLSFSSITLGFSPA